MLLCTSYRMIPSAIRKIFYEFRDFSVIFFRAFRRGKISEKSGTSKIFEYCTRNHVITNLLSTQKNELLFLFSPQTHYLKNFLKTFKFYNFRTRQNFRTKKTFEMLFSKEKSFEKERIFFGQTKNS